MTEERQSRDEESAGVGKRRPRFPPRDWLTSVENSSSPLILSLTSSLPLLCFPRFPSLSSDVIADAPVQKCEDAAHESRRGDDMSRSVSKASG